MAKPSPPDHQAGAIDPADRARVFTIQLRHTGEAPLSGRVIHLASGESAHFDTADELVALLLRANGRPDPPGT
ncbi:MAG: hypothetical protein AB7O28_04650 [Vicinamibacterales bacterium]